MRGEREAGPAAARWRTLVRARLAEVQRLAPRQGSAAGPAYWDSRARRFAARLPVAAAVDDPLLRRLRRCTGGRTTVLDVGAGPGRFALNLAPRVAEVIAVDPSPAMLRDLRRQARDLEVVNVHCVVGRWEEVDVPVADVAFSSFVLPLVEDAGTFLRKLDAAARRQALLYLSAFTNDALLDPLWRHFHGRPRRPAPTYLDAVAVLVELGLSPTVAVVQIRNRVRYATMADAVADYCSHLLLPSSRQVRSELGGLLASWLMADGDGFVPPLPSVPAAIISWTPKG